MDESKPIEVSVGPDSTETQRLAIIELVKLHQRAIALRSAMDFCADHATIEDMLANGLAIEAALTYAHRAQCSLMDAREYIARVLAERAAPAVALATAANDSLH